MLSRTNLFAALFYAVIICVANPLKRCSTGQCARTYTVVTGDTCQIIEDKRGVSSFQLMSANPSLIDAHCDNLAVGEKLCLGIIGEDCQVTHAIQAGDTCESIVARADTTLDILLANNPTTDCDALIVGDVLCTADDVIVTPC